MVISVQFFGTQRAITKVRDLKIPLTVNGRVKDVHEYLMNRYPDLSLNEKDVRVTINNKSSSMNHILKPNDNIVFLPHVGGG